MYIIPIIQITGNFRTGGDYLILYGDLATIFMLASGFKCTRLWLLRPLPLFSKLVSLVK